MDRSVDQFKAFVKRHPKLRSEVREGRRNWQSIYEEWSILGEDDDIWLDFENVTEDSTPTSINSKEGQEFLKSAINYVKKINPDDIGKYLNNFQKVIGLVQMFNGGGNKNQATKQNRPRRHIDPLFRRYDEYDD